MLNARAGIIINTGEDNYLTTADAFSKGYTVIASDFINEAFALRANLEKWQMGLGHAFEIDPATPTRWSTQIADAQLVRQLFPEASPKYMPPTKYMPGDIFQGHVIDAMFNFTGIFTGQDVMLLGMLTEALHTPFIQDRALAIENARYVFTTARHLSREIRFAPDGVVQNRADQVLEETHRMLADVASTGLPAAIEAGRFAAIRRPVAGGKGASGVCETGERYLNPFADEFARRLDERREGNR
jgi:beta-lysine 5,6-aminomutase alpha subunit